MASRIETIGPNIEAWREPREALLTPNQLILEDRMDSLQQQAAEARLHVWFGHEIEFRLRRLHPDQDKPDKERFYELLVRALTGSEKLPPAVDKATMVNPTSYPGPVLMNHLVRNPRDPAAPHTYNPDQPGGSIIEIRTAPAEWREATARYWKTLYTIADLASSMGYAAQILSTHQSTVITRRDSSNQHATEEHSKHNGDQLLAMQLARRHLQPYETYAGLVLSHESYPSKAALWSIHPLRVETRYPAMPIVDPRVDMLGALAGVVHELNGEVTDQVRLSLHDCERFHLRGITGTELSQVGGLMVWDVDEGRMVLPKRMRRSLIQGAVGARATKGLDELVSKLTGGTVTDYSENNAQVLRQVVDALRMTDEGNLEVNPSSPYCAALKLMLGHQKDVWSEEVVRIAADSPYGRTRDYGTLRQQAAKSPMVARFLGRRLLKSLTPPDEAHARRLELIGNT